MNNMYTIVKLKCSKCGAVVELENTPFFQWKAENFKCEKCEELEYAPITARVQKIINERGHSHNVNFYKINKSDAGYTYVYKYNGKKYIVMLAVEGV